MALTKLGYAKKLAAVNLARRYLKRYIDVSGNFHTYVSSGDGDVSLSIDDLNYKNKSCVYHNGSTVHKFDVATLKGNKLYEVFCDGCGLTFQFSNKTIDSEVKYSVRDIYNLGIHGIIERIKYDLDYWGNGYYNDSQLTQNNSFFDLVEDEYYQVNSSVANFRETLEEYWDSSEISIKLVDGDAGDEKFEKNTFFADSRMIKKETHKKLRDYIKWLSALIRNNAVMFGEYEEIHNI